MSLAGVPCHGDNTAPTPVVEESTSTVKGLSGSEELVMVSRSCWNASVADGDQDRNLGLPFNRLVSGLVM